MSVSYDVFIGSFLEKVTERDLLSLENLKGTVLLLVT